MEKNNATIVKEVARFFAISTGHPEIAMILVAMSIVEKNQYKSVPEYIAKFLFEMTPVPHAYKTVETVVKTKEKIKEKPHTRHPNRPRYPRAKNYRRSGRSRLSLVAELVG